MALPQVEGAIDVPGLTAPVTVVRDQWGIPHISAADTADLFLAQGFVQAQDRLFQMDLWRRAALGELSGVLGANFIQRDAMTRRMQYRGELDAEWSAYPAGTREIVTAFTRGVNAWIDHSRDSWPDEFRLAGWRPAHWAPEDLLNRTDAFVMSTGGEEEVLRARLSAVIGVERMNAMMPGAGGRPSAAIPGVDLSAITPVLGEAIQRAGASPFFAGFSAPFSGGSNVWALDGSRTVSGQSLLAVDPHRPFEGPALRYLVHLKAPGWNVAGATAPWLPGVVFGHNDRLTWGMAAAPVDVQDIYVERINPANAKQVQDRGRWVDMTIVLDRIPVKGREEPFEFERQYTRHGVVVGLDRQRNLAYVLRWSGMEAGAAAELSALALDRAQSLEEGDAALDAWRMPTVDVIVAEAGNSAAIRRRRIGLTPRRRGFDGGLPVDGWSGTREWDGWMPPRQPTVLAPPGMAIAANDDELREGRLRARLADARAVDVGSVAALQQDVVSPEALMIVSLLAAVQPVDPAMAEARRRLMAWSGAMDPASADAQLYVAWRRTLVRTLLGRSPMAPFASELAARVPLGAVLSAASRDWFGGDGRRVRDALLVETLQAVVAGPTPGAASGVVFRHPLAISEAARERFNVGPFAVGGDAHSVQAISSDGRVGPALRAVFDTSDWDQSMVTSAPGQSGWPDSAHYRDMADRWSTGSLVPFPFSPAAVRSAARATLTLRPVTGR